MWYKATQSLKIMLKKNIEWWGKYSLIHQTLRKGYEIAHIHDSNCIKIVSIMHLLRKKQDCKIYTIMLMVVIRGIIPGDFISVYVPICMCIYIYMHIYFFLISKTLTWEQRNEKEREVSSAICRVVGQAREEGLYRKEDTARSAREAATKAFVDWEWQKSNSWKGTERSHDPEGQGQYACHCTKPFAVGGKRTLNVW